MSQIEIEIEIEIKVSTIVNSYFLDLDLDLDLLFLLALDLNLILMRTVRLAYALALTATLFWCFLLVAAPACVHAGGAWAPVGETIYTAFHPICHQIDGRSVHVFGLPLAACSRCSAIYCAFLLGLIAYPFVWRLDTPRAPSRVTLALAIAPMLLDVILTFSGIHASDTVSRLLTGMVFGVMVPFVVMPVYLGAVLEHSRISLPLTTHTKGTIDA